MVRCFDWNTNTLNIETNTGIKFNLVLKGYKTIVCGNSATGKTLLCNVINGYMQDSLNDPVLRKYNTDNIFILNAQNKQELKTIRYKLIIVDRADLILDDTDIEIINSDTDINKYLIFSRKPLGIYISPNYFGELKDKGDGIEIEYLFNVGGWN